MLPPSRSFDKHCPILTALRVPVVSSGTAATRPCSTISEGIREMLRMRFETIALFLLSIPLYGAQSVDRPPDCSGSQTKASFELAGTVMGTWHIPILITNRSSSPCTLEGSPKIERLSGNGGRMPTKLHWPVDAGTIHGSSSEILQPKAQAYFVIEVSGRSGFPPPYPCASRLRVSLPGWSARTPPLEFKVDTCSADIFGTGYVPGPHVNGNSRSVSTGGYIPPLIRRLDALPVPSGAARRALRSLICDETQRTG